MSRINSTIKKVLDNKNLIINKIDEKQENDFLCTRENYERTLSDNEITLLVEGLEVSFIPNPKNGFFYANDLKISSTENITQSECENVLKTSKVTTRTLTDAIIGSLKRDIEHLQKGDEFEDLTLFVLKALGVSEIYAIPRNDAGGRADGILKVSSISTNGHKLEVIYDCTLNNQWMVKKETQISNYKDQITKREMKITYNLHSSDFQKPVEIVLSLNENADKQIWIITREKQSRTFQVRSTESEGEIVVKEISIFDLLKILQKRYLDPTYLKVDSIVNDLKNLGSEK